MVFWKPWTKFQASKTYLLHFRDEYSLTTALDTNNSPHAHATAQTKQCRYHAYFRCFKQTAARHLLYHQQKLPPDSLQSFPGTQCIELLPHLGEQYFVAECIVPVLLTMPAHLPVFCIWRQ